jgi:hypothetical protein
MGRPAFPQGLRDSVYQPLTQPRPFKATKSNRRSFDFAQDDKLIKDEDDKLIKDE